MADKPKPTPREKRRVYVAAFCLALLIDLIIAIVNDTSYRPTMIGLAIMIAAGLFFLYSLIRDR